MSTQMVYRTDNPQSYIGTPSPSQRHDARARSDTWSREERVQIASMAYDAVAARLVRSDSGDAPAALPVDPFNPFDRVPVQRHDFGVGGGAAFGSSPSEEEGDDPGAASFERQRNAWKTPSRNRRNVAGERSRDASVPSNKASGPGEAYASVHRSGGPSVNPSSKSEHGRSAFGGGNQGNNAGGFAGGTDAMTPDEDADWANDATRAAADGMVARQKTAYLKKRER